MQSLFLTSENPGHLATTRSPLMETSSGICAEFIAYESDGQTVETKPLANKSFESVVLQKTTQTLLDTMGK